MDRRSFLTRAGLLGAGLAVPTVALGAPFPEATPPPDKLVIPQGWSFLPLTAPDKPNFGDLALIDRSHYNEGWQPHLWTGDRWMPL